MSDPRRLFLRHRCGDPTALPDLIDRLAPRLRALALRMGLSSDRADDAVQETWLAAMRSADAYDAAQPFQPWLHALLRHSVASQRRREQRQFAVLQQLAFERDTAGSALAEGDAAAARAEAAALLRAAIRSLPVAQREPLTLSLLEGLSPKAIALRLELPPATVRVLLHRGRRAVRRQLPQFLALALLLRDRTTAPTSNGLGPLRRLLQLGIAALVAAALVTLTLGDVGTGAPMPLLAVGPSPAARAETAPAASADPSDNRVGVTTSNAARLAIRVRDAAGRGAAAVGVTVERDNGADPRLHRRTAVTDADGVAWFDADRGPLRAFADRGGEVAIAAGAAKAILELPPGRTVAGLVTDPVGRPLPEADIWVGRASDDGHGAVATRTAADGTFTLQNMPATATIAAFAPGCRRTARAFADAAEVHLVALPGGTTVRIHVRDDRGRPIAGARLFAGACGDGVPARLPDDVQTAGPPAVRATTDASGSTVMAHLEPGLQPIAVRAPGCAPQVLDVVAIDGKELTLECRLTARPSLVGRAVADDGTPIAGASIVLHSEDRSADVVLRTGVDGSFCAECVPAGIDAILATATGHACVRLDELDDTQPVTAILPRLQQWTGVLADEWGAPLADHEMRFDSSENLPARADVVAWTDAAGRFAVDAPGEALCRVHVRGRTWPMAMPIARTQIERHGNDLKVTVPRTQLPTARLLGQLREAEGAVIAGRHLGLAIHLAGRVEFTQDVATTDAFGRFAIEPLPAGSYSLVLDGRSERAIVGAIGPFAVPAGGVVDASTALATGEVAGAFRFDDDTVPLQLHTILRLPGSDITLATRAGDFALRALPGGYDVSVVGEGFGWINGQRTAVRAGTVTRIDRRLQRAVSVKLLPQLLPADVDFDAGLWLADDVGRRVCHFPLDARAASQPRLAVDLPPGDYVVEARRHSGSTARAHLRVATQAAAVDVPLRFGR